jgi:hypothetical protein
MGSGLKAALGTCNDQFLQFRTVSKSLFSEFHQKVRARVPVTFCVAH